MYNYCMLIIILSNAFGQSFDGCDLWLQQEEDGVWAEVRF